MPAAPRPAKPSSTVTVSPRSRPPGGSRRRRARPRGRGASGRRERRRRAAETAPSDPPDIDTPRIKTDAPPPPPEPLTISDTQILATSSSSVQVAFKTSLPAQTRVSYGIGTPVVWSDASSGDTLDHQATISGLAFSTTYQLWLHAVDEYGQTQAAALTVATAPMSDQTVATTSGSKILLNGNPFFPITVWGQCSDGLGSSVADGINLFMGDGCGAKQQDRQLAANVGGRAYSVVSADDARTGGRGVIGWYFPDEWDAFLDSNVTRADIADQIPDGQPGKISFLTLTNHFYSHAAPLPQGRGMYPLLYSPSPTSSASTSIRCRCGASRPSATSWTRSASSAAPPAGSPRSSGSRSRRWSTPAATTRRSTRHPRPSSAETWLAIAGGADGIGYFPNRWAGDIGATIADTNRQIQSLAPALLAPSATAQHRMPRPSVSRPAPSTGRST